MAARTAARHSIWPLAGYALLTIAAFVKGPPARSRILYPHREHTIATFDEAKLDRDERTEDRAATGKATWWSLIRDAGCQWVGHKDARLAPRWLTIRFFPLARSLSLPSPLPASCSG